LLPFAANRQKEKHSDVEDQILSSPFLTYSKACGVILTQAKGIAFQILDSKVEHLLEAHYVKCVPIPAGLIEELADKLGIDRSTLTQTIGEFNSAVQEGTFTYEGI